MEINMGIGGCEFGSGVTRFPGLVKYVNGSVHVQGMQMIFSMLFKICTFKDQHLAQNYDITEATRLRPT